MVAVRAIEEVDEQKTRGYRRRYGDRHRELGVDSLGGIGEEKGEDDHRSPGDQEQNPDRRRDDAACLGEAALPTVEQRVRRRKPVLGSGALRGAVRMKTVEAGVEARDPC